MAEQLFFNPSTLVIPLGGGLLRLFQVHDRRNVIANLAVLPLVDLCTGGADEAQVKQAYTAAQPALQLADATTFSLWDHAYANPDFWDREVGREQLETLDWEAARELLVEHRILVEQWPPPRDYDKRHFADRFRGSFYEQVATESLFNRTTPTEWWTAQKFEADHQTIRPTPYRYIEERFLERFIKDRLSGANVLDIGCGTGYFTAKIAQAAKRAIGVDYNEQYVDVARKTRGHGPKQNLEFQVGDMIDLSNGEPEFAKSQYDWVTLVDTFLFLFDNRYQPTLYEKRDAIVGNLKRLLKPGGTLFTFDPHPLWLTAWLGDESAPFGVLTEYRHRHFKVIPTLDELTAFLAQHDLHVRRLHEPVIDPEFKQIDPQRYAWMDNVPQWLGIEIVVG